MGENDELIKEFLIESYDNLDRLDREFMALEKDPTNKDYLSSIFRTIHTIKGTSGFFGFERLQALTHVGENLLSKLRDGKLTLNGDMTNALLAMVDAVRGMLGTIESSGEESQTDNSALIATLSSLQEDQPAEAAADHGGGHQPGPLTAMFEAANAKSPAKPPEKTVAVPPIAVNTPIAPTPKPPTKSPKTEDLTKGPDVHGASLTDNSIRVDVTLLDRLMNLVGELVLARNQILQLSQDNTDQTYIRTTQRLSALTSELQEGVMKTRMQPIGNVWSKFPRVVRDLSAMVGKQVRIEMAGKETELDKTLIEAIKDPLTHIVRNSIDHGIEMPEQRIAAGKPVEGTLSLRAFHESGQVVIEIVDDGGGINTKRVVDKAIEKGLITQEQSTKMSEREMVNLIFAPGFSTAEKVTNISGRGVGMDVVKTNIERIGGTVDFQNRFGQGTTLRIKIPLTLAIIPALIVTSGGDRFAIPQVSLIELLRLDAKQMQEEIENVYGAPVYRLRGHLLPVVFLNNELRLTGSATGGAMTLVVLHAEERRFCLVVDSVNDAEEIVVKPLAKVLKPLSVFAGATIMGDGRAALILDVLGIAKRAHAVAKVAENQARDARGDEQKKTSLHAILVFQSPDDGRMAIPVAKISRLEEIEVSRIEHTGGAEVVQYRGIILPLIRIFNLLPERRDQPRNPDCGVASGALQVVIHTQGDRSVGLVVGRIIDTVEHSLVIERAASRAGIVGCLVVQERITELLDVERVVGGVIPDFYQQLQPA
jgi:two-component system, chemotaxis family, sensor kinase CheA